MCIGAISVKRCCQKNRVRPSLTDPLPTDACSLKVSAKTQLTVESNSKKAVAVRDELQPKEVNWLSSACQSATQCPCVGWRPSRCSIAAGTRKATCGPSAGGGLQVPLSADRQACSSCTLPVLLWDLSVSALYPPPTPHPPVPVPCFAPA